MRLVLIEWIDSVYHDMWEPLGDVEPSNMLVKSVGWLAKDTPDYKMVVPHQQCDQTRGGMTIPSTAVIKITDMETCSSDSQ